MIPLLRACFPFRYARTARRDTKQTPMGSGVKREAAGNSDMNTGNEQFDYYQTSRYTCMRFRQRQSETLYLTLCGVEQCVPGYAVGPFARDHYHLHVVLSGRGILQTGGTSCHIHANQMFLLKPCETAYYEADREDPWQYCWLTFDGSAAQNCMEAAGFSEGVCVRECFADSSRLLEPIRRLLDCTEPTAASELRRMSLAMEFLARVIESNRSGETAVRRRRNDSSDLYVDRALDMIHLNYASLRIGDIARSIGVNRSYLTKIFREKMGISPQEFLLHFRLNLGCNLLLTTNASIQEIAQKVGYENPLTFSKIFKSVYGISPRSYRHQGGAERREESGTDGGHPWTENV